MADKKLPATLQEAIIYFADPQTSFDFMVELRWPDGMVRCPRCGSDRLGFVSTRRIWQCKDCKRQFSVKVGTIFEDSPLGLDKWLAALWMVANCKNGISSYEVHRGIGVTQKTAWFMLQRIRLAMQIGSFQRQLDGEVEADETFVGGQAKNMHKGRRTVKGTGGVGKTIVFGILERGGEVRASVVPDNRRHTVQRAIRQHVRVGAEVFTDALPSYEGLSADYVHQVVNHTKTYAEGRVHTNGIENFWGLLKRCVKGTYIAINPDHLFRYVDEEAFRFNNRSGKDADRFEAVASGIVGKRLTYRQLVGEGVPGGAQ